MARHSHLLVVFYPCRDGDFNWMRLGFCPSTMTGATFFLNFLTCPVADVTGCLRHHSTKWGITLNIDYPRTMTLVTGHWLGSFLGTRTMTGMTFLLAVVGDGYFLTKNGFLEFEFNPILKVITATGCTGSWSAGTTHTATEEGLEDIFKATKSSTAEATKTATTETTGTIGAVGGCVTILVVHRALISVT